MARGKPGRPPLTAKERKAQREVYEVEVVVKKRLTVRPVDGDGAETAMARVRKTLEKLHKFNIVSIRARRSGNIMIPYEIHEFRMDE